MTYTKRFDINFEPVAAPEAIVIAPGVRFTVLTERLLRLEFSPRRPFEDRPSQPFWYRRQPVPEFTSSVSESSVEIETGYLQLRYDVSPEGFTPDTLSIELKQAGGQWHFGQENTSNLLGTARTLDNIEGALSLEQGLVSRGGWALVDDSASLVFDDDGWLTPRGQAPGELDLYFFGYGQAFKDCLRDYQAIAGKTPLLPRWVLGNWWSRYWPYSAGELLGLMDEFQENEVPLSVCIVDMEWHLTDTDNASSGWTGYTWNRELFPDPAGFIEALHERDLKTALNLHPADGVFPHEEQYEEMAARLDVDPDSEQPIPFDIADPAFTKAYFEILHHPHEAEGIDFWWMDWQQGTRSAVSGLDPLWWLNHLHFHDLARHQDKRAFVFSRWGGLGNHRYPIGFSGDTVVSWDSLAFQPYFTATAANVCYSWWSHDIGGHMGGLEDAELYTRWVQYGVFSPILRLHCTRNMFHERRPWGYDAETEMVTREAFQLRHALIPYLYTLSWQNAQDGLPPIRPMYYEHPGDEQSYHCPDQYTFGSELIAAPFIAPAEEETSLSRQVMWLPLGDWFQFFDGHRFQGNGWQAFYGTRSDIPVLARAGGIVPLAPSVGWGGVENPAALEIHLFPGANRSFSLYEDDGLDGASLLPIRHTWSQGQWQVEIGPVEGERGHIPQERDLTLLFRGLEQQPLALDVRLNGRVTDGWGQADPDSYSFVLSGVRMSPGDMLAVTLTPGEEGFKLAPDGKADTCQKLLWHFKLDSWIKQALQQQMPDIINNPRLLEQYELSLSPAQLRALTEVICEAGFHRQPARRAPHEQVLLWNNQQRDLVSYRLSAIDMTNQPFTLTGSLPSFAVFALEPERVRLHQGSAPRQHFATVAEWANSLPDAFQPALAEGMSASAQFVAGDTAVLVTIRDGELAVELGERKVANFSMEATPADWLAVVNGEANPFNLFRQGRLQFSGDFTLITPLISALGFLHQDAFQSSRWRLNVTYLDMCNFQLGEG